MLIEVDGVARRLHLLPEEWQGVTAHMVHFQWLLKEWESRRDTLDAS